MATTGYSGRGLTVSWDGTVLVGARTIGMTINSEPVDITTDDDAGVRTLLAQPGVRSVDLQVAGVVGDEVALAEVFATLATQDHEAVSVALPTGNGTVAFSGMMNNLQYNKAYDGTVEYTANIMSSGALTYTPSS
jgi:predicted secreted protein